ncbi:MAG: radical SAM protein [Candidatus Cloacimonadaceae bacterium]|jgi:histone acetyltransferase (RNA polymerase elongator complex component)
MKHKTKTLIFPIFLPMQGCKERCIYCDQNLITSDKGIDYAEQLELAKSFLQAHSGKKRQVAFYGGTFTGLEQGKRDELIAELRDYLDAEASFRISTHPLFIDEEIISWCKESRIKTIELGIQDFDGEVLRASGRNYTTEEAITACRLVKEAGLELGVQLMPGLPGARSGKEGEKQAETAGRHQTSFDCGGLATAGYKSAVCSWSVQQPPVQVAKGKRPYRNEHPDFGDSVSNSQLTTHNSQLAEGTSDSQLVNQAIVASLQPHFLRLYPVIVIRGTVLHQMWLRGEYQPLSLEEAVHQCADWQQVCDEAQVKVIKMGLPSQMDQSSIVAGPWHPAFGQLVQAELLVRSLEQEYSSVSIIKLDKKQWALIMANNKMYLEVLQKRLPGCRLLPPTADSAQAKRQRQV